jgi:uncharacterized protein YycO
MKPYAKILHKVDTDFEKALKRLKEDPLFGRDDNLYTDDDKKRIAHIWKDIVKPFLVLRRIIRVLYWRSFFFLWSKNSFVVKYASIVTYYNMIHDLRESFWPHEEFIRQYLDDTFSENYSTLARYMYHVRFLSVLWFPREFFLTLRDEVDPTLWSLFDREAKASEEFRKRTTLDLINVWYYIRFKISLLLTWIAKHGWRLMMNIRFSSRKDWLIQKENIDTVLSVMKPWDILLTRQNWTATNLNIPGFWKHMTMYIGTGKYLKDTYDFESLQSLRDDAHYIIEAVGIWVQIIPLETLCHHNDYLWILRPCFTEEKIMRAIRKTLPLVWKEYDYSFNFYSDVNYVCSTLVTKAYLPEFDTDEGIHITLTRVWIGITYPPNDLARKYHDEHANEKSELQFVGFIDSIDRDRENFIASEETFRVSGFRSKFSFFLQ